MALVTTSKAWEGQQERDRLQSQGLKRKTGYLTSVYQGTEK